MKDKYGRTVYLKDKNGKTVIDPNTGKPKPKTKKVEKLYGAAFDIVLTKVPVFWDHVVNARNAPVGKFKSHVLSLRAQGLVAWHRWAREHRKSFKKGYVPKNSDYGSIENEIHSIDPQVPISTSTLWAQVKGYYQKWPSQQATGAERQKYKPDWGISDTEINLMVVRANQAPAKWQYYKQNKGLTNGKPPAHADYGIGSFIAGNDTQRILQLK